MGRLFFGKNGEVGEIPHSKGQAREAKWSIYDSKRYCTACKDRGVWPHGSSARFLSDDSCVGCARFLAEDLYNISVGASVLHVQDEQPGLMARMRVPAPMNAGEWRTQFTPLVASYYATLLEQFHALPAVPMPRDARQATEQGLDIYLAPDGCRYGHVGLRRTEGGCYQCWVKKNTTSPRQKALAAGETLYLPDRPCDKCGAHSEKRVSNGSCLSCEALRPKPTSRKTGAPPSEPDAQMMRDTPDIVISREMAKGLGFKVFRTGKACKRGHKAFRYVSTGGCIDCHKGW